MRHLYVVIDCSRSMEDQDLKPNRLTSTLKVNSVGEPPNCYTSSHMLAHDHTFAFSFPLQLMEAFVDEYFDQNPISQVCFIHAHILVKCAKTIKISALILQYH